MHPSLESILKAPFQKGVLSRRHEKCSLHDVWWLWATLDKCGDLFNCMTKQMDTPEDDSHGILSLWTAHCRSLVQSTVRLTAQSKCNCWKVLSKAPFWLYLRRVPTANKCPFSHQTLFDPADCQLTVDFLSNTTRFLRTFLTALFGTATGSLLSCSKQILQQDQKNFCCTSISPKGENRSERRRYWTERNLQQTRSLRCSILYSPVFCCDEG